MNSACAALSPRPYLRKRDISCVQKYEALRQHGFPYMLLGKRKENQNAYFKLIMKSILFNKRHWESVVYSTFLNLKPQLGKICQNIAAFRSTLVVRFSSALCFGMHPTPSPFVLRGHAPPPFGAPRAAGCFCLPGGRPSPSRNSVQFPVSSVPAENVNNYIF